MSEYRSRETLYLDLKRNVIECEMISDKKYGIAKAFNWTAFGGALANLVIAIFAVFSIAIAMLIVVKPTTEGLKTSYDFIINQFKITKWLFVGCIAVFGSFSIAASILYFLFLKKAPSRKLIVRTTICWSFGIVISICSLLLLIFGHNKLSDSFSRYENTKEKVIICSGLILMIISSCLILIPDITLLSGNKKCSVYDTRCTSYLKLIFACRIFAYLEIGTGGFTWLNIFIFGNDRGGYTVFLRYLWMASYFIQIVLLLCSISSMLLHFSFIKRTSGMAKTCVSHAVMYCGFILSFYFICTQCYNNSQLEGTFDLLGVFKLFIPSIYYVCSDIERHWIYKTNFK